MKKVNFPARPKVTFDKKTKEYTIHDADPDEQFAVKPKGNLGTFYISEDDVIAEPGTVPEQPPIPPTPDGTEYYISQSGGDDSNDGLTTGTAWETLDKLKTEFEADAFMGGDNINLKRGDTWTEELLLDNGVLKDGGLSEGSEGLFITIRPYDAGNNPMIDGAGVTPTINGIITIRGLDWIKFESIDSTINGNFDGFWIDSSANCQFYSCNSTVSSGFGDVFQIRGGATNASDNLLFSGCTATGDGITDSQDGFRIVFDSSRGTGNCDLVQCTATTTDIGFNFEAPLGSITATGCYAQTSKDVGFSLGRGNFALNRCYSTDAGINGIAVGFFEFANTITITNCVFLKSGRRDFSSNNMDNDITIRNCIFYDSSFAGDTVEIKWNVRSVRVGDVDFNCYFVSAPNPVQFDANEFGLSDADFPTWVSTTGFDNNSFEADPLFTSDTAPYDLTLQPNSPCIGTGENGVDMGIFPNG